ncbi:GFA family protein [Dasania sp. GY-19]|uniref:GFA family protein n=2 Tax=Dasania phycosphaerae TaxID=2950436 RepID=A0A9J6RJL9_9GAMM|nr:MULTISPECIES: GFA family protein [Dasania]MCZ0864594.1 GFA family protein [Dasania phycosphaerae]
MSKTIKKSSRCLCGQVEIHLDHMSQQVGACHCSMCRTWGGGPYMEVNCGTDVSFTGEEHIKVYASSDWAERGFCGVCGTHLFYRLKQTGEHMVPIGLLGDEPGLVFKSQVFIDEKPDFYSFANQTQTLTGPEVFALFSSADES